MDYFFQLKQLTVGYDHKPLIREMEIGLEKGKILTLIGPNGAGKSTILKTIAKQLEAIEGTIFMGGKSFHEMSGQDLAKEMAIVLTERLRTECMTCEDVIATGRYPYTGHFGILTEKDWAIVNEAIKLVNIGNFRNRDFTKISDGQRQRVMLARAICQEPEIILLDEPTSFLDVKYKLEFLSILQKLQREKQLTVIMSLHELELAQRVSDQILCVKGEYIERFGEPEFIFEDGYIRKLFEIEKGSFCEKTGTMELEATIGNPKVFVIGGNGTGAAVYRKLQRERIPFVTGILYTNDLDYPAACGLATEVISNEAFEPVTEEVFAFAKKKLSTCQKLICCRKRFGSYEEKNKKLLEYAMELGLEVEME